MQNELRLSQDVRNRKKGLLGKVRTMGKAKAVVGL